MTASSAHGEQLPNPPSDGVTALRFAAASNRMLASSWDGSLRLFDTDQKQTLTVHQSKQAVLDCTLANADTAYSGGVSGNVRRHMLSSPTAATEVVGSHDGAVSCTEWLSDRGMLVTAGWDSTLRLWDPRISSSQAPVSTMQLPGKAYSMSVAAQRLVVATSGRHIVVCDIRNLEAGQPVSQRESPLKYQSRCVCAFPNGAGFAVGSVEGRVALEYYDPSVQIGRYAFKCHRRADVVFPVNAISFHPLYGTFATGGCDGVVSVWDGLNKKRLWQTPTPYPTSIAALAFSGDGRQLAIASSYTFELGDKQHPPDAIYIRQMADLEVQPKQRPSN